MELVLQYRLGFYQWLLSQTYKMSRTTNKQLFWYTLLSRRHGATYKALHFNAIASGSFDLFKMY